MTPTLGRAEVGRKAGAIIDFEVARTDARVHIHRVEDPQIDEHAAGRARC